MDSKSPALSTWQASRTAGPISATPNGEQRIAFLEMIPTLIAFIGTLPLPDGDHETMLSYDFMLGPQLMGAWLPGVVIVPAPAKPAVPAAGAGAGTVEVYRQSMALCGAYKANVNRMLAQLPENLPPEKKALADAIDSNKVALLSNQHRLEVPQ